MTTTVVVGLGVAAVILAALGNLLANWADPPAWLTPGRRWAGIAGCVLVLAAVAVIAVRAAGGGPAPPGDDESRDAGAAPATVADLVPELAEARLLSIDDSAGRPTAYVSGLDGRERRVLWDAPDSWPAVVLDDDRLLLAAPWEERGNERLEVFTTTGRFDRALTDPPADRSDSSPSLAADAGHIYFVRTAWQDHGGGTKTSTSSRLMRVPVSGGAAEPVDTPGVALRSVSAAADGSVVAGQCVDDGGPLTACVVETATGRVTVLAPEEPATVSDVAISPDGRRVAYSAPVTNAYGESQIHIADVASGATTMATRLSGANTGPAWVPSNAYPCLVFEHYERAAGPAVHLLCLRPEPVTVLAVPIGSRPVWLG